MKTGNYLISNLVSRINIGYRRRLRFIEVSLNETSLEILKILYKHGAIRTFFVKDNKILIYLKYYFSRFGIKISIISKPGQRKRIPLRKLSLIYNNHSFSGFYIISTQKGINTSEYCLLKGHISGEIIIKVEV